MRLMSAACAGMFVFGIVMAVLGAILPSLFDRIGFDKGEAGNLFLFMNFAMLVMSLVFGPVVDRFGYKAFLLISSLLVAGAFLLLLTAGVYGMVVAAAVLLGFGGGGLNGGTNALTSDIHPKKRSSALNLLGIFFGFGALTIPFIIGALLGRLGLRNILLLALVMSFVPVGLFALIAFPHPKQAQGFPLKEAGQIVREPLLWLCAFLLFFQSGNEFTLGGWISTYLQERFAFPAAAASLILAGYWAAIMSGRLLSTRLTRAFKNENLVLASAVLAFVSTVLLILSPSGTLAAVGAVTVGLGFAAVFPTTLAVVGGSFPKLSGTAFSVVFVVALSGGMISPWLAGKIAQASSLKEGLFITVFNCAAVIILQLSLIKVLKKKRRGRSALNNDSSGGEE
jgi:fucose permease